MVSNHLENHKCLLARVHSRKNSFEFKWKVLNCGALYEKQDFLFCFEVNGYAWGYGLNINF